MVAARIRRLEPHRMAAHLLERQRRGEEAECRGGAGRRRDQHLLTPSTRATSAACAGPAPPKPTMA